MGKITPSSAPENFAYEPVRRIARDFDALGDLLPDTRATLEADPTRTPKKRALELLEWVQKKEPIMSALFGRAANEIGRREEQLRSEINAPWRGAMVSTLEESEIRSAFRSMPDRQKAREIALEAILRGDGRTMRALQNDPGYLAGFPPDFRGELHGRWSMAHFPNHVKELASLETDTKKLGWAANSLRAAFDEAAKAGAEPAKAAAATDAALKK